MPRTLLRKLLNCLLREISVITGGFLMFMIELQMLIDTFVFSWDPLWRWSLNEEMRWSGMFRFEIAVVSFSMCFFIFSVKSSFAMECSRTFSPLKNWSKSTKKCWQSVITVSQASTSTKIFDSKKKFLLPPEQIEHNADPLTWAMRFQHFSEWFLNELKSSRPTK